MYKLLQAISSMYMVKKISNIKCTALIMQNVRKPSNMYLDETQSFSCFWSFYNNKYLNSIYVLKFNFIFTELQDICTKQKKIPSFWKLRPPINMFISMCIHIQNKQECTSLVFYLEKIAQWNHSFTLYFTVV